MNRPLRFRVWDTKGRRWIAIETFVGAGYVDLNDSLDGTIITQFTGLTDSKGKDIYEGDIVIWDDDRHVVSWLEGSTGWFPFASQQAWAMYFNRTDISLSEVMVIGNIFQNPDLLK